MILKALVTVVVIVKVIIKIVVLIVIRITMIMMNMLEASHAKYTAWLQVLWHKTRTPYGPDVHTHAMMEGVRDSDLTP